MHGKGCLTLLVPPISGRDIYRLCPGVSALVARCLVAESLVLQKLQIMSRLCEPLRQVVCDDLAQQGDPKLDYALDTLLLETALQVSPLYPEYTWLHLQQEIDANFTALPSDLAIYGVPMTLECLRLGPKDPLQSEAVDIMAHYTYAYLLGKGLDKDFLVARTAFVECKNSEFSIINELPHPARNQRLLMPYFQGNTTSMCGIWGLVVYEPEELEVRVYEWHNEHNRAMHVGQEVARHLETVASGFGNPGLQLTVCLPPINNVSCPGFPSNNDAKMEARPERNCAISCLKVVPAALKGRSSPNVTYDEEELWDSERYDIFKILWGEIIRCRGAGQKPTEQV